MYIEKKLKDNKGVTLITLVITLSIMVIISVSVAVNFSGYRERRNIANLQSDIKRLKEEVDHYYIDNNELPIANEITDLDTIQRLQELEVLSLNDNDTYYVIDLSKFEGIKLNFGIDFYKIENKTSDIDDIANLDIYIINEQSHTIYYPKGIKYKDRNYYALNTDDDEIANEKVTKAQIQKQNSSYLFGVKYAVTLTDIDNLDYTNCKYRFTNSKNKIGKDINLYTDGNINNNNITIEQAKGPGNWYLHVLLTDNDGIKQEIVSDDYTVVEKEANFDYTGSVQTANLLPGDYKLETWGAQGGSVTNNGTEYHGGYGAYSVGNLNLTENKTLDIVVGGQGKATYATGTTINTANGANLGGYNGGGNVSNPWTGNTSSIQLFGTGGGCTHIAYSNNNIGELKNYTTNEQKNNILLVSGAGGGAIYFYNAFDSGITAGNGLSAGGYVGKKDEILSRSSGNAYVGTVSEPTQTTGGIFEYDSTINSQGFFGIGGNASCGGGSGYFGGAGSYFGGMGGISYMNSLLTAKHMTGYNVETSDAVDTKTISTNNVSSDPISDYAKKGNGYARITNLNEGARNYIIKNGITDINDWVSIAESIPGHGNSGPPTIQNYDGYIQYSCTGGSHILSTKYKFNISKYTNLYVVTKRTSACAITIDNSAEKHFSEQVFNSGFSANTTNNFNISSITGEKVISLDLWGENGLLEIVDMWLE